MKFFSTQKSVMQFLAATLFSCILSQSAIAQTGDYWVSNESVPVQFYGATPLAAVEPACEFYPHQFVVPCQNAANCSVEFTGARLISPETSNPRTYLCTWYRTSLDGSFQSGELATGNNARRYQYDCSSLTFGEFDFEQGQCVEKPTENENTGCGGENAKGNPCNVATGNKYQIEKDFSIAGFSFQRTYNSQVLSDLGLGQGWRSNFQRHLKISGSGDTLIQASGTGKGERWNLSNGEWLTDADTDYAITQNELGFRLEKPNGASENYTPSGLLSFQTDSNGQVTNYQYNSSNQLISVSNQYGQSISFEYENDRLQRVIDPLSNVYTYSYDSNNNLISVTYPGGGNGGSGTSTKVYHYENATFPNHLTGITDENGNRYGTYAYDAAGKAISTEHAQTTNSVGQEQFQLDFQ